MQCVEHEVDFNGGDADADCYKINARDFFVPTQV